MNCKFKIYFPLALLSGVSILDVAAENETSEKRPNVLLITADDLNCNSIGVYGSRVNNITPNIDRLASNGIQFLNAHVASAVSQPSRGALATGLYPHSSGIEGFYHTNKEISTIVPTLQLQGYYCAVLGKQEHSSPTHDTPWNYAKDLEELGRGRDGRKYQLHMNEIFKQAKASKAPFYLMVNSHDPHRPFHGTAGERRIFGTNTIPQPSYIYTESEIDIPHFLPDISHVRKEVAQYYNSVKRLDDMVGLVLHTLKESGHLDNTIIVFLSDNGMSQPFSKTNCYYQSTRTPLIVSAPLLYRSAVVDDEHMISIVDFFPTILDVLGMDIPKGLDGKSFEPILMGEKQADRTRVFTEFQSTSAPKAFPMRAIHSTKYTLIFNPWAIDSTSFRCESSGGVANSGMKKHAGFDKEIAKRVELLNYRIIEEFYDTDNDPNALVNLIAHPAYQDVIAQFSIELSDWMRETNDPLLDAFNNRHDLETLRQVNIDLREYVKERHAAKKNK